MKLYLIVPVLGNKTLHWGDHDSEALCSSPVLWLTCNDLPVTAIPAQVCYCALTIAQKNATLGYCSRSRLPGIGVLSPPFIERPIECVRHFRTTVHLCGIVSVRRAVSVSWRGVFVVYTWRSHVTPPNMVSLKRQRYRD